MTEVGKRVKEIRNKRGLSQEDLAELSKVNLRTIQRIENNETTPRGKTLRLIYDALDIMEIESEKVKIDKYLIWSSFLTLSIIISSFLGWLRFTQGYANGVKIYKTLNGWNGSTFLFDYDFNNWLLSISAITVGFVVIGHSLRLIENKLKYIALQLFVLLLFLIGVFQWSFIQAFELRPGLFIMVVATILLVISYRKKERKGC